MALTLAVETRLGGAGRWIAWALAVLVTLVGFAAVELWLKVGAHRGLQAWMPRLVAVAAIVFGLWFAIAGQKPHTSPWWFAGVGLVVTWLLFSWMKLWAFLATVVIIAGSLAAVRVIAIHDPTWIWPLRRIWIALAISSVGTTILATVFQVTPRTGKGRLRTVRTGVERTGLA